MHTHRSGVLSGWPKAMGLIQPAVRNQGGTSEMLSTKCAPRGSREAPGIVGGAQGHLCPVLSTGDSGRHRGLWELHRAEYLLWAQGTMGGRWGSSTLVCLVCRWEGERGSRSKGQE